MKKLYITFVTLLVLGISSGVFYFSVYKQSGMEFPEDVAMETAYGEPFVFTEMEPKVRLLEFIYTNCPDICPVTTYKMKQLREEFEQEGVFGNKVEFITITIDPAYDTKEVLQEYGKAFELKQGGPWYLLRGSEEDTKKVAEAFEFLYRDPGDGQFIHSAYTYLLDDENNIIEIFGMGEGFDKERVFKRIMRTIN
ncbi:SCO family protein [Cytobacillus sp. IB215316]|uniref:SCO family protein n=1 Tax=Cytobacillus sp. IB215316 TaxID=3097354 RepID=UPI002A14BAB2|nr:SCO family protein [Cytobacillus sp. IB215316]MDX8361272.1 SCO family protein [Cytobacillus sp. IB215316]